jgi:calcineurin-like phosphoesterase family protein
MRDDLTALYDSLMPRAAAQSTRRANLESLGDGSGLEGIPGATPDHSPLRPEEMDQLEQLYRVDPEAVRKFLGRMQHTDPVTPEEARKMLDTIRRRFATASQTRGAEGLERAPTPPPSGFTFDLYDPKRIPIDVTRTDFEEGPDWFKYAVGAGISGAMFHAGLLPLDPFRRHEDRPSLFSYPLDAQQGQDLRIGMFSDFANGYYHARYIAKRLAMKRYPYAIHLGDVYYAGREAEVRSYLEEPLAEVLPLTELFLLQGNHEMYAKARPWLAYLDGKRMRDPARQRQEGTYFTLTRPGFQIIGIDTEWFGAGRFRDPWLQLWLRAALERGRREGRINILLSSDEPYSYNKAGTTDLYGDLRHEIGEGLIDLWFWGNTHYCALFERTAISPFIGTCIGHAGFPYGRIKAGARDPGPTRWVEDGTRFGGGAWSDPRPDRGNNGFCEMLLKTDGSLELEYIDWMGRTRHRARIAKKANGVVDFVG